MVYRNTYKILDHLIQYRKDIDDAKGCEVRVRGSINQLNIIT